MNEASNPNNNSMNNLVVAYVHFLDYGFRKYKVQFTIIENHLGGLSRSIEEQKQQQEGL